MTIITTTYKVLANNTVVKFDTELTEKDFCHILDCVYGIGNWSLLEINPHL